MLVPRLRLAVLRVQLAARRRFCQAAKAEELDSVHQTVAYQGVWGAVRTFPMRMPFATNILLTITLFPMADAFSQYIEGAKKYDSRRGLLFFCWGLWNGTAWWVVYVSLFRRMFPRSMRFANMPWAQKLKDIEGQKQLAGAIAFDTIFYVPLVYWPAFYSFKAVLQGESNPVVAGVSNYSGTFVADNAANAACWIPGDFLMLVAPAWARLPVSHGLTFTWNMGLSYCRGQLENDETASTIE